MKLVILLKLRIICAQSHLLWLCGKLAICEKKTRTVMLILVLV